MNIYCCGCKGKVEARLTNGGEIYPHRNDLRELKFWKCDGCNNFVGTHKNSKKHHPLGCIPTAELKNARKHIHEILDPVWQSGKMKRKEVYQLITDKFGWQYHTAQIRTVEEAREIYKFIKAIPLTH